MKNVIAVVVLLTGSTSAFAQAEATPPTALEQYLADGVTVIPVGGGATSTTLVLEGIVHGSGATQVRLEVEIRPITDPFTQISTHQGAWVNIDTPTSVTISGLIPGQAYHWQATTVPT
jgi:hypothetical protein